ncbi:hypothetical protein ABZT34_34500 [Streptomyces sp. NPDC005329]|uniref:hypothetical protein n=1 Tax=Streptomyces sp. NPDC005329 TaxID=3157034 RepID=UPI0033A199E7
MTEQNPLAQAEAAVRAAEADTDIVRIVAAVLAAQQATQQPTRVAQQATQTQRPIGLYIAAGIGGAVALTFLAMAAALLAVAVAVGAVAVTVCVLVLRSVWQDMQRGR